MPASNGSTFDRNRHGLGLGDGPSPEEAAHIEAEKRRIREANAAKLLEMRDSKYNRDMRFVDKPPRDELTGLPAAPEVKPNPKSKYKGVYWHSKAKKWQTSISVDGTTIGLGLFDNEIEAAYAVDAARLKHGSTRKTTPNFPGREVPAEEIAAVPDLDRDDEPAPREPVVAADPGPPPEPIAATPVFAQRESITVTVPRSDPDPLDDLLAEMNATHDLIEVVRGHARIIAVRALKSVLSRIERPDG